MESRILLSAVFVISCFIADAYAFVAAECTAGPGWTTLEQSDDSAGMALIDLKPDTIVLGKPFSFNFKLCPDDLAKNSSLKPDRVVANATMPAHKHGMNYNPTVEYNEESKSFKVEDFVFHMPGKWVISLSTYKGEVANHYTQTLTVN